MTSDEERCAEHERFKRIDAAFRAGDLAALRAAVEDPDAVPNGPMPLAIGPCLEYAIYHSPLSFIRTLLEIGADPNPEDHIGFPPLIAALSRSDRASRDVAGIGEVEGHPTEDHLGAPVGTPWHWRGCNLPFNLVRLGPRGPKRP